MTPLLVLLAVAIVCATALLRYLATWLATRNGGRADNHLIALALGFAVAFMSMLAVSVAH